MDAAEDRKMRRLVCLALVFATLATFWRAAHNNFINFDDDVYVTGNPWVSGGLTVSGVIWAFTHFCAANWHPLTWISHMLDCQLFGLNPGPQHAVNVVFHAANAVLLFLLLNRMTGALWRSAMVAGLFALHPLHVESVAWIAERKDLLCTFFGLLSLLAYARYVVDSKVPPSAPSSTANKKSKPKIWFIWALIFFALGLMSKPMLVTLPFVMLLLDFWPLARLTNFQETPFRIPRNKLKTLAWEKWPFFGLTLILCVVTYCAQKTGGAMEDSVQSSAYHVANALVSYVRYIGRTIWPAKLAVIYPFSPISIWEAVGAAVLLLAISVSCVAAAKRRPYLLMGWLWYLGTLVPVIGLIQVGRQSSADRYAYIPVIGLFIMCVWGAAEFISGWRFRKQIAGAVATLVLLSCAVDTTYQLQFWKNGVTLFGRALAVTTDNALAQNDFAAALASAGQIPAALPHYQEAAQLAPDDALIQNNYGVALIREGMTNEAIARYEEAIRLQTNYVDAYNNLGAALAGEKHFDEAFAVLSQAVALQPDNSGTHENLGALFIFEGRPDDALAQYHEAIRLNPGDATVHVNFGLTLLRLGQAPRAVDEFSEAVRVAPDSPEAQFQLGRCLAIMRQPLAAVGHLREASRLQPEWTEPLNALAWILATDGDAQVRNGTEAVHLAETAAGLTQWQDPVILNTLAAAYAEAGRFDDAVNTATRAIELAQQSGQANLAAQIQSLLVLYQQRRAFHHP